MFQFLQTWDGVRFGNFGVEHIGYIRKAMLYSWLTSRKCYLDLTSLLIFADKGCFIELLHPRFILFLTTAWFRFFMGKWDAFLFICGLHLLYTSAGCIDVEKWAELFFYMWVALLYTSGGCIAVEKWSALLFICGLHCCIQVRAALL